MEKFYINNISDLIFLRLNNQLFDEITVNATLLQKKNIFRFGLKYAFWNLKVGGEIVINCNIFRNFSFQKKYIDFWQTAAEIGMTLKEEVKFVTYNKSKGVIRLEKLNDPYINTGVSFGIVFSGNDSELDLISKSIHSCINQVNKKEIPNEIIICGPSDYDVSNFEKFGINLKLIKYLPSDIEVKPRILICIKKNRILKEAKYNIVSISHGRIEFPDDYLFKVFHKKFDFISPKVEVEVEGKKYPFLDIGLIGSYDIYKRAINRSISVGFVGGKDFFNNLKNRVVYNEGGVVLINKTTLNVMFNENLAWGEGEDVDLSARAYYSGALIDYYDDIKCLSNTAKFNAKLVGLNKIKFFFIRTLVSKGII